MTLRDCQDGFLFKELKKRYIKSVQYYTSKEKSNESGGDIIKKISSHFSVCGLIRPILQLLHSIFFKEIY